MTQHTETQAMPTKYFPIIYYNPNNPNNIWSAAHETSDWSEDTGARITYHGVSFNKNNINYLIETATRIMNDTYYFPCSTWTNLNMMLNDIRLLTSLEEWHVVLESLNCDINKVLNMVMHRKSITTNIPGDKSSQQSTIEYYKMFIYIKYTLVPIAKSVTHFMKSKYQVAYEKRHHYSEYYKKYFTCDPQINNTPHYLNRNKYNISSTQNTNNTKVHTTISDYYENAKWLTGC